MTKKEKAGKKSVAKHVNQTANQRAMKNPKTQAILSALRKGWNGMSAEQQGEQVLELIALKCSVNGIADELERPATTIRRRIEIAKSPGTNSGWIGRIERTLANRPLTPKTKGACKVACCRPSETPTEKAPRSDIKEMDPVKNEVHSSTTQQTKRITSSSSPSAQVRPVTKQTLSDKDEPKIDLLDLYNSRGSITQDRIRRLEDIADSIPRRPDWNARSMKRQGGQ